MMEPMWIYYRGEDYGNKWNVNELLYPLQKAMLFAWK